MRDAARRDGESGFVLLVVILGLAILAVLALGLVLATKPGVRAAHAALEASKMHALADAVITLTAVSLLDTAQPTRPRVDGIGQVTSILGHKIWIKVTSEFGKVDLNVADSATLTRFFEAAGLGPAPASEEARRIIVWRTAGKGAIIHRFFRSIAEITWVKGITRTLYRRIASSITVYSARGRVDRTTAPLLALQSIAGIDRLTAESIVRDRLNGQAGVTAGEIVRGRLVPGTNITGWAFSIDARFSVDGQHEHTEAVIRITGDPARPYFVLWRDDTPE
ncbi:type II secretion system protein GspK [Acidiphilium iwatense]|nr:type II secretion system protein GspK [Acidiphilium iwatense]